MTTRSTASSGTDGPSPDEDPEPASPVDPSSSSEAGGKDAPGAAPVDEARRAFFLEFGKQAVSAVGQVAGMVDVVGRTSGSAAASLLRLVETDTAPEATEVVRARGSGSSAVVTPASSTPAADDEFRSPYRLDGDQIVLLDQRRLPESIAEVAAKRGSDVAYYLRIGVCRGGPAMAQAAAYGLALTAAERADGPAEARRVEIERTRRTLAAARPSSRSIIAAMERLRAVEERMAGVDDGAALAAALRAEADAIAAEAQVEQATMATELAASLVGPSSRSLGVLVHGDPGALAGGSVGVGIAALRQLAEEGTDLSIFVTETRPFMDGARLASWELRQAGLDHRIVPDAAVAWLFAREPIDAVLIDAEWVAANGDVAAVVGSRAVAQLAGVAPERDGARPRVLVATPLAAIDPAAATGEDIPVELRPARDLVAYLSDVPVRASDALSPASDVVPASATSALVTAIGVVEPTAAVKLVSHPNGETEGAAD